MATCNMEKVSGIIVCQADEPHSTAEHLQYVPYANTTETTSAETTNPSVDGTEDEDDRLQDTPYEGHGVFPQSSRTWALKYEETVECRAARRESDSKLFKLFQSENTLAMFGPKKPTEINLSAW